ncbi:MAG: LPS assembly lipoprotein LptE [Sphingobacteriales bacterium]
MKRIFLVLFVFGLFALLNSSCTVKLNGETIPATIKTINVEYFENNAPLVVNYLSQNFTEAIKSRIRSQTSLSLVQGEANAHMSGSITGYSIEPVSVQATNNNVAPIAGAERLTITVNVTFKTNTNALDRKAMDFTQSFSEHQDFTGDISTHEQALINTIVKQLTDDIFNKAFANW